MVTRVTEREELSSFHPLPLLDQKLNQESAKKVRGHGGRCRTCHP